MGPTLCESMDCSTPGLPVHHQHLEFTKTHGHPIADSIQLSHPLSPLLLPPSVFPSIRVTSIRGHWDGTGMGPNPTAECLLSCFSRVQLLETPWTVDPQGSSVHGILQAKILEWVAISFSRGIFLTQGSNLHLLPCRQTLYH